jgi:ferredoxin
MIKNVINTVVANDLCVGCRMCVYMNEDVLQMKYRGVFDIST